MTPIQPPMTDERLDRLVRQLLTERADDVAAAAMPAETMAAVVASHVRRGGIAERRTLLLVAAGLLIVLAAGAVAVGSGLIRRGPEPQPAPQPVVVPSLDATAPIPSDAAMEPEHVFYTVFDAASGRRRGLHRGQCESVRQDVHELTDLGRRPGRRQRPGAVPGEHRLPVDRGRIELGRRDGLHCANADQRPADRRLAPRRAGASRRRPRHERHQRRGL